MDSQTPYGWVIVQCTATSKQSKQQCKKDAIPGRRVCHIHGGKSLAGIVAPAYKDGRYSKYIPDRLKVRYEAAREDSAILALRDDISLVDARLTDLLGRVDTGESGALWSKLKEQRIALSVAQRTEDRKGQADAINAILSLIDQGHADYRAWSELQAALEQRKRLVESERKRLVEMQQMITAAQAQLLLQSMLDSVKEHVRDRDILSAIQTTFIQLTAHDDSAVVDNG